MSGYRTTERLYVNADRSRIVPEDSSEAAFLLAAAGKEISAEDAEKYGLVGKKAAAKPADKSAPAPENKASGVTVNKRR